MTELLTPVIVSGALGALIGLIRQWDEQIDHAGGAYAGLRTHTLWAVLGCLGAFASESLAPFAFVAVLVLVSAHLIAQAARQPEEHAPGSTSFAGALLTIFCGALVFWDKTKSAVVVAAATMVLVGIKRPLHTWIRGLNERDIRATLQFAAISGVILPLVPNQDMGPFKAFNPYSTWLMVVLISGLSFAGYIAMRIVRTRAGIVITGVLGGLASSTASTLAFSRRSREDPRLSEHYALAVVAACTVMLPRVLFATSVINQPFALSLIVPFALMAVPGTVYAAWIWRRQRSAGPAGELPEVDNPLGLGIAIKFAVLYSGIAFLVKVVREQGWSEGLLPLAFVSGLTDMDAISLSIAYGHGVDEISSPLAVGAVVLAAVSNTLLKGGMAVTIGSPGLKRRIAVVLGATAATGALWLVLAGRIAPGA